MSHKGTIRFVDLLGTDYDEPVKAWCKELTDYIWKVWDVLSILHSILS